MRGYTAVVEGSGPLPVVVGYMGSGHPPSAAVDPLETPGIAYR